MPNPDVLYKIADKRQSYCHFTEGEEQEVNAAQHPDSQILYLVHSAFLVRLS